MDFQVRQEMRTFLNRACVLKYAEVLDPYFKSDVKRRRTWKSVLRAQADLGVKPLQRQHVLDQVVDLLFGQLLCAAAALAVFALG